jgi:hypothetical protein
MGICSIGAGRAELPCAWPLLTLPGVPTAPDAACNDKGQITEKLQIAVLVDECPT